MYPWPRFLTRYMRQFNADVIVNAPKDRTLFNYSVKVRNAVRNTVNHTVANFKC